MSPTAWVDFPNADLPMDAQRALFFEPETRHQSPYCLPHAPHLPPLQRLN